MAKINKTYKPGDEFTPDSVNEIVTAVNENTNNIANVNTKIEEKANKRYTLKNINLDHVIESGFYRIESGNTNLPDDYNSLYSQLLVISGGGDTICQMIFPYTDSKFFYLRVGTDIGSNNEPKYKPWAKYSGTQV